MHVVANVPVAYCLVANIAGANCLVASMQTPNTDIAIIGRFLIVFLSSAQKSKSLTRRSFIFASKLDL